MIAGIDWVTANHGRPAGGGQHEPRRRRFDRARTPRSRNSIADGVVYAVAAGNDNANACNCSPGARRRTRSPSARPRSHRRPRVVLELRHLRGHLRAGPEHHLVLVHAATRRPTRSAARRWRRRTWPAPPRCCCRRPGGDAAAGRATRWSPTRRPNVISNPGTGSPTGCCSRRSWARRRRTRPPTRRRLRAARLADPLRHLRGHREPGLPAERHRSRVGPAPQGRAHRPAGVDFDVYLQKLVGSTWTKRRAGHRHDRERDGHLQRHHRHLPLARPLLPRLRELLAGDHATLIRPART